VPHRLAQLRRKYACAVPALTRRAKTVFPPEVFTWENFLWAHVTYSSRGFPAQLVDPSAARSAGSVLPGAVREQAQADGDSSSGPSVVLGDGAAAIADSSASAPAASAAAGSPAASTARSSTLGCLIPYMDLTNHKFMQPITWMHHAVNPSVVSAIARGEKVDLALLHPHERELRETAPAVSAAPVARVSLRAGAAIPSGSECFNNYGAKASEELLMGYGFTTGTKNVADELTIALGARAVSQEKLALVQTVGIKLHHHLRRGEEGAHLDLLVRLMRACAMDERAMQEASAAWLPAAVPKLMLAQADSVAGCISTVEAVLSSPNLRFELSMLHTLRGLLLGRLKRLQLHDPASHAAVPAERQLLWKPASSVDQVGQHAVRTVQPAYFKRFAAVEHVELPSAQSRGDYHTECALVYRLGQRDILLDAVAAIDERIMREARLALILEKQEQEANSTIFVSAPELPEAASAAASAPVSAKKRKTVKAASTPPVAPNALANLLVDYEAWLASAGAQANADWSSGVWKLRDSCALPAASSSAEFADSPPLLVLPSSLLITLSSVRSHAPFASTLQLLEQLDLSDDADIVFACFLAFERMRGAKSPWAPWIAVLSAMHPALPLPGDDEEASLPESVEQLKHTHEVLSDNLTTELSELWDAEVFTIDLFLWAARVAQGHRVRWVETLATGQQSGAEGLLPVPAMPLQSEYALSAVEIMPVLTSAKEAVSAAAAASAAEPSSSNGRRATKRKDPPAASAASAASSSVEAPSSVLVFRSFVSLAAGALAMLCVPVADRPELPMSPFAVVPSASAVVPLKCTNVLALHEELMAQQESESDELPCGLPLVSLSRAHQQLWERMGVDEGSCFVRTAVNKSSALLDTVLRSLFLSAAQLRHITASPAAAASTPSSSTAAPSRAPLTGALVDDSDEEEEQASTRAAQGEEDEEEDEEAGDDDDEEESGDVDERALRMAVHRFRVLLDERELLRCGSAPDATPEPDASMPDATAASSNSPAIVPVSAARLLAEWGRQQRRLQAAVAAQK